jgi:hypothetical protein
MSDKEYIEDELSASKLIASKRHKELVQAIKGIVLTPLPPKNDTGVKDELATQTLAIKEMVGILEKLPSKLGESIPVQPKSDVKVELNQDKVVNSINELALLIIESQAKLQRTLDESINTQKQKKEWEFTLKKNRYGETEQVIAKQIK